MDIIFYLNFILFLGKLYAQYETWTHDLEIKIHMFYQLGQPGAPQMDFQ